MNEKITEISERISVDLSKKITNVVSQILVDAGDNISYAEGYKILSEIRVNIHAALLGFEMSVLEASGKAENA